MIWLPIMRALATPIPVWGNGVVGSDRHPNSTLVLSLKRDERFIKPDIFRATI